MSCNQLCDFEGIIGTLADQHVVKSLVTCSFTSHECEQHSYIPALYSGPYHVKKQSLQLFGINHLLFSGIGKAMPFYLHHTTGKAVINCGLA